jgi:hypothetical protein
MKIIYLFVTFTIACLNVSAQGYQWQWAETAIAPNDPITASGAVAVAADSMGNIYTTGYFWSDSITFGAYTLYNHTPGGGFNDVYIVKYNSSGIVLWANDFGGTSYDFPNAIALDKNGNAYVAGGFQSVSVVAGPSTIYNTDPTDTTYHMFLLKVSTGGNLLWAEGFGGDYYDEAYGVATDQSGNVYVAGFYQSDSLLIGQAEYYNCTTIKNHNAILIKCDSSGQAKWVETGITPNGGAIAFGLCTDMSGHEIMVGRFGNGPSVAFGSQVLQNDQVGYADIFVVEYDSAGNALWAQRAGGSLDDYALAVAADAHGNSYVTGWFNSSTALFGSQSLDNDTTNNTGDIFVAKYDNGGNLLWVNGYGGDHSDVGQSIAVDTSSNVYITGYYYSPTVSFGSHTITNFVGSGATDDVFVAIFDSNGNPTSATETGNLSYDFGNGVCLDRSQNLYVAGAFKSDEITFGTTTLVNSSLVQRNDNFLAKYVSIPTGINTSVQEPAISLYPNPANDQVIAESASFLSSHVIATVYDLTGKIMTVSQTISADKITFGTSQLAAGLYLVKFSGGTQDANAKFVKVSEGQ